MENPLPPRSNKRSAGLPGERRGARPEANQDLATVLRSSQRSFLSVRSGLNQVLAFEPLTTV